MIETIFEKLPENFLATYKKQIMAWAKHRDSQTLEIRLLRKPGGAGTVLDIGYLQETVSLLRQVYRHPVSGEIKVAVGPASDFDTEIIELHCQNLPVIIAARSAAARAWAQSGSPVSAYFEKIPDAFVRHYDFQFRTWGAEIKQRGHRCAIVFDLPPGAKPELDEHGRPIMKGAWFEAEMDWEDPSKPKLIIRPVDEATQELIERHTREMAKHWLS